MLRHEYASAFAGPMTIDAPAYPDDVARLSRVKTATIAALAALAALNIADVVTTHMLIAHRAVEANPLAGLLLTNQTLLWVKLAIVVVLALRVVRSRGRLGVMGAAFFAAGIYATAVLSNLLVLHLATSG